MAITVVEPGRRVEITPVGGTTMADVLEYAELAILSYGFRQGPHDVEETELWESPAKHGLSLHDAVGLAFVRLSGTDQKPISGSKDARLAVDDTLDFGRNEVYAAVHDAVEKEMPGAKDDWKKAIEDADSNSPGITVFENWFNNTTDQDTVIRVLRLAREEAVA